MKVVELPKSLRHGKYRAALIEAQHLQPGQAIEIKRQAHSSGNNATYWNVICQRDGIAAKLITRIIDGVTICYAVPHHWNGNKSYAVPHHLNGNKS